MSRTRRPGEEALVAWLSGRLGRDHLLGDDTASLPPLTRLVATVDQQIEGTHFYPGLAPAVVARRLLAVNLSDLAASGAVPRLALLALAAPAGFDHRAFFRAFVAACRRHGVTLAGGDLARAEALHLALTLLGERPAGAGSLARDRARPGEVLWLGGTVGEAALGSELAARGVTLHGTHAHGLPRALPAGLARPAARALRRHLLPRPQLELGSWLAARGRKAGAAIDLSDGLAKDLRRLVVASGVGAELDLRALKRAVAPSFIPLAEALGLDPIAVALAGGEDYVLLFTLPEGVEPPARFRARAIGRTTRARSIRFLDADGKPHPLPDLGWDHLAP